MIYSAILLDVNYSLLITQYSLFITQAKFSRFIHFLQQLVLILLVLFQELLLPLNAIFILFS